MISRAEYLDAIDVLCDVINQACQVEYDRKRNRAYIDDSCIGAYEWAFEFLEKRGYIRKWPRRVKGIKGCYIFTNKLQDEKKEEEKKDETK